MKRFVVAAAVWGAAVGMAAPSGAAPSFAGPACTVLTDAAGDETFFGDSGSAATDRALDLLSATLRSDGRTLRATIRVSDLSSTAPGSRSWVLNFGVEGNGYQLQALQSVDGTSFMAYGPGGDTYKPSRGSIAGRFDSASNAVVMDVPLRQLGVKPQARFLDFSAIAAHGMGTAAKGPMGAQDVTSESDSAAAKANYRLDRGCR